MKYLLIAGLLVSATVSGQDIAFASAAPLLGLRSGSVLAGVGLNAGMKIHKSFFVGAGTDPMKIGGLSGLYVPFYGDLRAFLPIKTGAYMLLLQPGYGFYKHEVSEPPRKVNFKGGLAYGLGIGYMAGFKDVRPTFTIRFVSYSLSTENKTNRLTTKDHSTMGMILLGAGISFL